MNQLAPQEPAPPPGAGGAAAAAEGAALGERGGGNTTAAKLLYKAIQEDDLETIRRLVEGKVGGWVLVGRRRERSAYALRLSMGKREFAASRPPQVDIEAVGHACPTHPPTHPSVSTHIQTARARD